MNAFAEDPGTHLIGGYLDGINDGDRIVGALAKARETRSQVGLTISHRSENVQDAYQADSQVVKGKNVLIMDDVATTGSTISACTTALLSAGAQEVYVLTIARALPHHGLDRV